jgi:hypothetical protein
MTTYARLYSQSDLVSARDAFHTLFRNALTCDQPLLRPGGGIILWDIRIELSEEQHRSLAAAAEGGTEAYLSYLGGYEGGQTDKDQLCPDFELSAHYRFDLALFPPRDFGEDWYRMAEHAIYSPHGTWGIITSFEWHGIAAGSDAFRASLLGSPVFADSLGQFLACWKDCRDRLKGRTSWVPVLLENVYGVAEADRILVEFGEPHATWSRNE